MTYSLLHSWGLLDGNTTLSLLDHGSMSSLLCATGVTEELGADTQEGQVSLSLGFVNAVSVGLVILVVLTSVL